MILAWFTEPESFLHCLVLHRLEGQISRSQSPEGVQAVSVHSLPPLPPSPPAPQLFPSGRQPFGMPPAPSQQASRSFPEATASTLPRVTGNPCAVHAPQGAADRRGACWERGEGWRLAGPPRSGPRGQGDPGVRALLAGGRTKGVGNPSFLSTAGKAFVLVGMRNASTFGSGSPGRRSPSGTSRPGVARAGCGLGKSGPGSAGQEFCRANDTPRERARGQALGLRGNQAR